MQYARGDTEKYYTRLSLSGKPCTPEAIVASIYKIVVRVCLRISYADTTRLISFILFLYNTCSHCIV